MENGRSEGRGPGTAANDDMMKRKQTCPTGGQAADNDGQKDTPDDDEDRRVKGGKGRRVEWEERRLGQRWQQLVFDMCTWPAISS
ncbi:GD19558 [Drosophila simulans]|uniref:GD19558 n=1 Tax=Drosophila simulans TaxID=7240 RepID=B4QXN9_DROSI|nr:GD19558 [Drosophila simulans]